MATRNAGGLYSTIITKKQVIDNWYSAYIKENRARKKREHWQVQELGYKGLRDSLGQQPMCQPTPFFALNPVPTLSHATLKRVVVPRLLREPLLLYRRLEMQSI